MVGVAFCAYTFEFWLIFLFIDRNNGILPLSTIPGKFCNRPDGLCALDEFVASQANSSELANYQYAVSFFVVKLLLVVSDV